MLYVARYIYTCANYATPTVVVANEGVTIMNGKYTVELSNLKLPCLTTDHWTCPSLERKDYKSDLLIST
jgi:hypothetical protein